MAEVYGEKPKMFTREWWPYFWMYYKLHTIIAIVAILGIGLGVYQKVTEVKYDLNLTYMAQNLYIGDNGQAQLLETLTPYAADANGDGEIHLYFNQINISGDEALLYEDADLRTKHDLEFSEPYSYLYIYDDAEFDIIDKNEIYDGTYLPISEWAEVPEDATVRIGDDGVAYGVSLKDSKIMADCGIDSDAMFVFVKNDNIMKEKNEIARDNAIKIANELIK